MQVYGVRNIKIIQTVLFVLILILTGFQKLSAQNFPNYSFRYFDVKSGLKGNEVYALSQDQKGLIWIGTNNGLYRFDGVNYYSFSGTGSSAPLSGHYRGIVAHSDGSMWVCTDYNGVSVYPPSEGVFKHYQPNEKPGAIGGGASYLMREDEHKNIWFAHFFQGISKFNYATKTFEKWKHLPGNNNSLLADNIYSLCPDMQGGIWIGYQNRGISYLEIRSGKFTHYTAEKKCGLNTNHIYALVFDHKGVLWVSAGNEIYYFSKENAKFIKYQNASLSEGTYYLNGYFNPIQKLIYFTSTKGLYALDPETKAMRLYELVQEGAGNTGKNRCTNLFFDRNNNLWVQFNQGFCLATEISNPLKSFGNLIEVRGEKKISYFEIIKDEKVYGIYGNKLYEKDLNGSNTNAYLLPDEFATTPLKEEEAMIHNPGNHTDYLLLRIKLSYYLYHTRTHVFMLLPPLGKNELLRQFHTYQSLVDSKGNVWILDDNNGLMMYDFTAGKWKNVNPGNQRVNSDFFYYRTTFREDQKGNVWCANPYFGIIQYRGGDPGKYSLYKYNGQTASPLNQIVLTICEGPEGNMYFAGNSGVLDCYLANQKVFIHYKRTACFEDNPACLVTDKNGYIWGFNNQSIYRMKPKNPSEEDIKRGIIDEFEYYSYDWKNGFEGDYFGNNFVYVSKANKLFFDAKESLYYIDPGLWNNSSQKAPEVFLTSVLVNGKPVSVHKEASETPLLYGGIPQEVKLVHDENNLEFHFAVNSLINAQNNLFKYKLVPYDQEWRYTNAFSPKAVYHNLQPGKYTFIVYGAGSEGIWSKEPTSIKVSISPGFFQSIWFKILIVLIVLLLLFVFYRIRINQIIRIQQERNKISRDLHDNIGSTISSAGFSSKLLIDNIEKPEIREKLVNKIQGDIKLLGESIDDIIWSINPKNDKWDQLFSRMRRYGADLLENSDISYSFSFDEELPDSEMNPETRKEIFLIYKESLNNIIKHAEATEVEIKLNFRGDKLFLVISDNGKGFDTSQLSDRNGLRNMQKRAELIKGSLEINSQVNQGTQISLIV